MEVIKIMICIYDLHSIQLRYDYDTTTTKNWVFIFCSRRMEAGARDKS